MDDYAPIWGVWRVSNASLPLQECGDPVRVVRHHRGLIAKAGMNRGAIGNPHHAAAGRDPVHHPNVLSKTAARRLKTGSNTNFFIECALGRRLLAAIVAISARNVMVEIGRAS